MGSVRRMPTAPARRTLDPARFADLLADYSLEVRSGERIAVWTSSLAAPLVLELQRAILARGASPLLMVELPGQARGFVAHAGDRQLDQPFPLERATAQEMDRLLVVLAPCPEDSMEGIAPERIARRAQARATHLGALIAPVPLCGTMWPTPMLAQEAGMSLPELTDFFAGALMLDRPDPGAAWRELRDRQKRLVERLAGARRLRIQAAGTELELRVDGRTWINSDGRHNMPSGEVYTSPLETSAEGRIRFEGATRIDGERVAGVELELRGGEGEAVVRRLLATDAGARRVGELGIGTNFGIARTIGTALFDEKVGGTVHLALGDGYAEAGGTNESAIHCDLVCDLRGGGRLTVDGEPLIESGTLR
jgi:aminopeptidase